MTNLICTLCGYSGEVGQKNKGNGLIELILWFFFLVPGFIYSIWRRADKKSICPKCKGTVMIPIDTPKGQKLASEYINNPNISNISLPEKKSNSVRNVLIGVVVGTLLILALAISIAMDDASNNNSNNTQNIAKQNEPAIQNNLPTEPQARIGAIIKSVGNYEVTLYDSKENLVTAKTLPPYEVIINAGNGKISDCKYAKNVVFDIMKKLYTDSAVKDKISRVRFTSWGHLSVSVGGEDGAKTDWNSSGPTNFWTVIMKYKPYEDETGKLNQRTWGKEIANNCD